MWKDNKSMDSIVCNTGLLLILLFVQILLILGMYHRKVMLLECCLFVNDADKRKELGQAQGY